MLRIRLEMVSVSDRPLADRRPDPTGHRLQAEPVLVGREGLDRRVGMARRFLGDDFGEFLKASCSSAVAAFGLRGRGFWIDQPIARNASQPRCGASEASPSSSAIQRDLAARPNPAVGRRFGQTHAQTLQQFRLQNLRRRAVAATQIAQRRRPKRVVTLQQLFDPTLPKQGHRRCLAGRMTFRQ
jgi:hypothetical protein